MATVITAFDHLSEIISNGALGDLDALTIKLALVTSSYTWDETDTQWADMSAYEVASGDGYTTGGETIASLALSRTPGESISYLDGADVTWSSLTKTFRRAIGYASGTFGALTNPVLFGVLYDNTPADVSVSAVDFTTVWNSSGILSVGS